MRVDPHACIMQALDPRINFRTQFQAPQRKFEGRRGCALSGLALFNAQQQRASPGRTAPPPRRPLPGGRGWRPPRPPRARKVTRREGSQPWPRGTLSAGSARGALRRRRLLCISSRAARAGAQRSPPRARHRPGRWTSTDPFTFSNNLRVHRATPILQMKGRAQRP